MNTALEKWIDTERNPIGSLEFAETCKQKLDETGCLLLPNFLKPAALQQMIEEAEERSDLVYYTAQTHNVYLTDPDPSKPDTHIFNRQLKSTKGCLTTDQVPASSGLHALYDSPEFKKFIAHVVTEDAIYPYADPLSGINVHFADEGRELNWHFDNSSFAITLLLQSPEAGGDFQYVRDLRDAAANDMNFSGVEAVIDGQTPVQTLDVSEGTLVLFRGRNALHRVTPTIGDKTRLLVVLAYNNEPGVALSEPARMTFFGRLG